MVPKTILVVDDNEELRDALSDYFGRAGFKVITAADGEEMWKQLETNEPNLIILDIMMPGDDGFTLCAQIRRRSNVPVIMLTAVTEESDRVAGLEMGADDYITKSFSPRELLARVKAILRRASHNTDVPFARKITFAGWTLDTITRQLLHEEKSPRQLSGADFSLLTLFLRQPNAILSRDEIAQAIWGRDAEPLERGIDVQISRLRNHLDDRYRELIITIRNKGYMLAVEALYES
ncbi:DNA-binding response regulator [Vibrio sp. MACH09]|uniref:response regulator transcription factor n=1 Tax=unclassified Vibrio TaxID=2614977 RepID=UPI0014932F04|nr:MULTISPECIES: response regulator transcription factor [unclassified Vibrio]NOI67126.1 response regulator transcription factor [Vibrio sp. 99-8-1]GLO63504.1 DNA-binding response regulator [Vibrio sp. MACH09]